MRGNHSINEYTDEFYYLHMRNNLDELDFKIIASGLRHEPQDENLKPLWTISAAIVKANKLEESSMLFLKHSSVNSLVCIISQAILGLRISKRHGQEVVSHSSHHNKKNKVVAA